MSSYPPPPPSRQDSSNGMPAVKIRRNTLTSARRPSQTLIGVSAPPPVFPSGQQPSQTVPEEGPPTTVVSAAADSPTEPSPPSPIAPPPPGQSLLAPSSANPIPTRTGPRARSRTIQSIFDDSAALGSPLSGSQQTRARAGSNASTRSPARRQGNRARTGSVSSGNEGVPVDLVLPPDNTPGRRASVVERYLGEGVDEVITSSGGQVVGIVPEGNEDAEEEHHAERGEDHHESVVNHLDVIDPTVSFVSHLQNVSSGILLPGWLMPRPTLTIPEPSFFPEEAEESDQGLLTSSPEPKRLTASPTPVGPNRPRSSTLRSTTGRARAVSSASSQGRRTGGPSARRPSVGRARGESYALIEHSDPLDQHVVDVLTKKQKRKRALKGVWEFIKTPFGICVAFYGFNVVFWGAAIVFFLAKFINFRNKYKQDLWVEITSQIVNALFTITGVGLLPSRLVDAYRMFVIWRLKRLSRRLLKEAGQPACEDENDLPDPLIDPNFVPVLTDKQQNQLRYQQTKFSASQTWYRPHATETHKAFPIRLALWNTLFMLGNSFFQVILCVCMWTLSTYSGGRITLRMGTLHTRPPWTTGCLIPLSFLCGIAAAVLIWKGGQQSKKVKEVEDKLRGALGIVEEGDEEDEAVRAGDVVEEKRIGPAPIGHHVQEAGSDSVAGRSSQEKSEARLSGEDNGTDAKGVALGRVV